MGDFFSLGCSVLANIHPDIKINEIRRQNELKKSGEKDCTPLILKMRMNQAFSAARTFLNEGLFMKKRNMQHSTIPQIRKIKADGSEIRGDPFLIRSRRIPKNPIPMGTEAVESVL